MTTMTSTKIREEPPFAISVLFFAEQIHLLIHSVHNNKIAIITTILSQQLSKSCFGNP